MKFLKGIKDGLPIALGYIPVSFSFGMIATAGGIPIWAVIAISMTNLTSAGQFAGANLIIANAPVFEIAMTTLIINIRYMLMSFVLSQKIEKIPILKRMLISFGITDEIFTVASTKHGKVGYSYMCGLILAPYIGWALGTILGALINNLLPESIASCMGITLYAMFIAIIVPEIKKSMAVVITVALAVGISCLIKYIPHLAVISEGWGIIIATIIASALAAVLFPKKEED